MPQIGQHRSEMAEHRPKMTEQARTSKMAPKMPSRWANMWRRDGHDGKRWKRCEVFAVVGHGGRWGRHVNLLVLAHVCGDAFAQKTRFSWAYMLGHLGRMCGPPKYSVSWVAICWPYVSPLS